jgi:hypothetical protein
MVKDGAGSYARLRIGAGVDVHEDELVAGNASTTQPD